jgi:hypothetical protein
VKLTRRHHPLEGHLLDVVEGGRVQLIVRLGDGTTMRVPRAWTDIDGDSVPANDTLCTLDSLREVIELIEALRRRS